MKKEKPPVAEYMKIRRYMLNFVEQAGEKSIQAPTILELSRKFGVSRPTVSKAMKMLTDDGYIIGRPGLGAFTNPAKINRCKVQEYKNVALIIGDGMQVHFAPFHLELLGRTALCTAERNFEMTFIQLSSHQVDQIVQEISMTHFDVLLWLVPYPTLLPAIRILRERGKRILVLNNSEKAEESNLTFNYEEFGYRIGKKLLAEGRRRIVYLLNTEAWSRPLKGVLKAYEEAGIELDPSLFFPDMVHLWPKLEKLLNTPGKVDCVFSAVCPTSVFLPFYSRLAPEIRSKVRFILEEDGRKAEQFSGWVFRTPFQEMSDAIGRLLSLECEGKPQDKTLVKIDLHEIEVNEGDHR